MQPVVRVIFIAGALWAPLSYAHAACKLSDLKGQWEIYSIGADPEAYWEVCGIEFDRRGRVRSGSSCDTNDGEESAVTASNLRLSRSCALTGSTRQGSLTCEIRATLSADKEIASGVGECGDGAIFLFNMLRR